MARKQQDSGNSARNGRGKGGAAKGRGAANRNGGKARNSATSGKKRNGGRRSWLGFLAIWGLVALVWLGIAGGGVLVYYAHDLPDLDEVMSTTRKPSVSLLASDGAVLASYGDLYGESISLSDLPPVLPQAVMAVEDRRFRNHFGLDPVGLARAIVVNAQAGRVVQGGSTITQQLAKNLFLTPERTVKRKVQELLLAFWLEYRFTKDQILGLYLNRVYLGAGTYGVDAAARRFFGKPASEINVYEAAMLAGLLKAPSRYNPASDPDVAHSRALNSLRAMVSAGYLTEEEARVAASQRSGTQTVSAWRGRYYADWVLGEVRDFVGYHPHDLIVKTTLDRRLQRVAEQKLTQMLVQEGVPRNATQGALVAMTPQGAVRALVGGQDYRHSQFNRATQARRQPGSAFKPFVYLAGMEAGMSPDQRFEDRPVSLDGWSPDNFAGRYYGGVTLRESFARSLNSVAVQVAQEVGVNAVARTAQRLGIRSELTPHPSLALGTSEVSLLELTGAYAVLANQGLEALPYGIEEIRDSTGEVLYRRSGGRPGRLVEASSVQRMTDVLRASIVWGTSRAADPDRPAAGKTGTSQGFRDAWFVGYTAELVSGVWLGNDDGARMLDVTGGTLPAMLWKQFTVEALAGEPVRQLPGLEMRVAQPAQKPAQASDTQTSDSEPAEAAAEDEGGSLVERIIRSLGGGGSANSSPDPTESRRYDPARGP